MPKYLNLVGGDTSYQQGKARQGKANLFVEHNSYTRQFKVLYSYIKSEGGKKKSFHKYKK